MWRSKVPPRVAFFSWTASLGKILTIENLWYKGVAVVDWCFMCKKSGELVNHLLLLCPIAYDLWFMVWALFGLQWVITHGVSDLFSSWLGSFSGHQSIDLWRAVPHCVYGVFGESGAQDVSKGMSGLLQILNLFFFIPC